MTKFIDKGWDYIPNILTKEEANLIRLDNHKNSNKDIVDDPQRGPVKVAYTPSSSAFLMKRLKPIIEDLIKEEVYPTYWFCTTYYNNCYMLPHTDRPSCEISVSLNIYSDVDWPIQLYDLSRKTQSVITPIGDGLLYSGIEVPHWREKLLEDTEYMQTFCHFVRKNGRYSEYKYDKKYEVYKLLNNA